MNESRRTRLFLVAGVLALLGYVAAGFLWARTFRLEIVSHASSRVEENQYARTVGFVRFVDAFFRPFVDLEHAKDVEEMVDAVSGVWIAKEDGITQELTLELGANFAVIATLHSGGESILVEEQVDAEFGEHSIRYVFPSFSVERFKDKNRVKLVRDGQEQHLFLKP